MNPIKILDTRAGRCAEWTIAFTQMCVALGYKTRICEDLINHVWTEVYINCLNKWVHVDVSYEILAE